MRYILLFVTASLLMAQLPALAGPAAPVEITDAWVRATAAGQKVGAAYMTLKSEVDGELIAADSNITSSVEIHSMSMKDGVMQMRMLQSLPLTAGEPYHLAPGGFHLMLFGLNEALKPGMSVALTLCFRDMAGNSFEKTILAPVKQAVRDHHH